MAAVAVGWDDDDDDVDGVGGVDVVALDSPR